MCCNVGYFGNNNSIPLLLDDLETLKDKGYDSADIAIVIGNSLSTTKRFGKI